MSTQVFEYSCFIAAPASVVYQHLTDPTHLMGLQPLLSSVQLLETGTNDDEQAWSLYDSIENFRFFGFIRYQNKIRALQTLTLPQRQIVNEVDSPFAVHVRFVLNFHPEGTDVRLVEQVTVTAPSFLLGWVVNQAKTIQQIRLSNLKLRMETKEKTV